MSNKDRHFSLHGEKNNEKNMDFHQISTALLAF